MKNKQKLLIIGMLFFCTMVTFNCQYKQREKDIIQITSDVPTKLVSDEFIYYPKNSTFKVVFPKKPMISDTYDLDNTTILSEVAQLMFPDGFIRSEVMFSHTNKNKKDIIIKTLQKYAVLNGLSNSVITETTTKVGPCIELRGNKNLTPLNENSPVALTYTVHCFFDKTSVLALYAGCESQHYPTPAIYQFYNSIDFK